MDSNYIRIVNAIIPSSLIAEVVNKTNTDKKQVEQICLEIIARLLVDGKGLSKDLLKQRIKAVAGNDELKNLLSRLDSKYGITMNTASKVLSELLPVLFRNISDLNDAIFVAQPVQQPVTQQVRPQVQVQSQQQVRPQQTVQPQVRSVAQPQPVQQVQQPRPQVQAQVMQQVVPQPQPVMVDTTVDDVYKNIEDKAKMSQEASAPLSKKEKKKLKKKEKKQIKELAKDKAIGSVDDRELSLIEKICMIVVFLALIALIGVVVVLFLKNK